MAYIQTSVDYTDLTVSTFRNSAGEPYIHVGATRGSIHLTIEEAFKLAADLERAVLVAKGKAQAADEVAA